MAITDVAIVDSGGANIASLEYALSRVGVTPRLTTNHAVLQNASHVILPGVGAAEDAMRRLRKEGLTDVLGRLKQPVLGICLGMQLLAEHSAEDDADCLGIMSGQSCLLPVSPGLPVPNMGWCQLQFQHEHPLLQDIEDGSYFYFVHSYALPVQEATVATAMHSDRFSAVLARDNFMATQFHPERSAAAGAQLLKNFLAIQL